MYSISGRVGWISALRFVSFVLLVFVCQTAFARAVSIGVVADNEPYSSFGSAGLQGFSIDVLDEVSRISGVSFEYRMGSWPEIYGAFLRGELDAVDEISWREDRAERMLFTSPYHVRQTIVMHDANRPLKGVSSVEDLRGLRIGMLRDVYYADSLRGADLDLHEYNLQSDLVRALAFGWVDAIIGSEATLQFFARQQGFANLQVVGPAPLNGQEAEDFRIAVQLDDLDLHDQLERAILAIDPNWIRNVLERWQEYGGKSLQTARFVLTPAQQATVRQQAPLRVGLIRDYAPLSFEDGGQILGFAVDVLARVMDMSGLQAIPVVGHWGQLIEMFQRGEIDVMTNISDLPARHSFARFTDPYHDVSVVGFTLSSSRRMKSIHDVKDLRVGYGGGIFYETALRAAIGENAIAFDSQEAMFQALQQGKVDLVLAALDNGNHWIRELGMGDVYIAGELSIDDVVREDLRFAVRPALEPLVPILNQALASISPKEMRAIENRWLGAKFMATDGWVEPLLLTDAEQAFLASRNRVLRFCAHPDWMPIEGVDSSGRQMGLASGMLSRVHSQVVVELELHRTASWTESVDALEAGQCDLLAAAPVALRSTHPMLFTDVYYNLPTVVLGRLESAFFGSMSELAGQTLAVLAETGLFQELRVRYPGLDLVEVESEAQGLKLVASGDVYGYVGTLATSSQALQDLGLADIRVLGRVPGDTSIAMATQADQDILAGILRRVVSSIPPAQLRRLGDEWVTVRLQQQTDYTLIWQALGGAIILLVLLAYWLRKLKALNNELALANRKLALIGMTDHLTGLGNRTLFHQDFERLFSQAKQEQVYFMVAMLDLDHFKSVNDNFGHAAGDECLRRIAEILRAHFARSEDRLVRYGGEEFLVFSLKTQDAQNPDAFTKLEQLRESVASEPVYFEGNRINLTVSIGYCLKIPLANSQASDWLRSADEALYQSKAEGRNRVLGKGF